MKLLSFAVDGETRFGALVEGGVTDLSRRIGDRHADLQAVIESGLPDEIAALVADGEPDFRLRELVFLPPLARPQKIICVGINYPERDAEYANGSAAKYPSIFMRTPGSLTGHGQALVRPPESHQLDYEGEIVVVVGKRGRRIAPEEAADHIAGYTVMNEGTIRDWLRHGRFNVTPGKNFDSSGAVGPWIATPDEMPPLDAIRITTHVNGAVRQDDTTANMVFPIADLVAYVSRFTTLVPGDMIATGTPPGAGARLDPPEYLKPGDIVTVTVSGIGTLENGVVDEVAAVPARR